MSSYVLSVLKRFKTRTVARDDRNIRWLMLQTALFGVVNGGVMTFLPILLARLGASAVIISLLTSLPAVVTIALALPAGAIAARWRDIVRQSARCFYLIRLSYPPIALAAVLLSPSLAALFIVVLWGLTAIPSTLGNAVFYDVIAEAVPPQRRARINGMRWALLGMVAALSVACFGQALEILPWPVNYSLMFAVCFVAGLLSTWCYSQIDIPPRKPAPIAREHLPAKARLAKLSQPFRNGSGFLTFSLVTLAMRLGLFLPSGVFSIFLVRNLQASDAWIGARTTVENSALTIGYFFWGRLAGRLGIRRMLALAATAMGSAYVLGSTATPATRWLLLCTALLWGFFVSAVDISLFEWLLAVMPAGERPRYAALNTLLLNVIAFVIPMIGAAIGERAGIPAVLRTAGGCLFACTVLTCCLARPATQKAARVSTAAGHTQLGTSQDESA